MKKSKKPITIESLAEMVAKGFEEQNRKMEQRFQAVDKRFNEIEEKMNAGFQQNRRDMLNLDERFVTRHEWNEFKQKYT